MVKRWQAFWLNHHTPQQVEALGRLVAGILLFVAFMQSFDLEFYFDHNGVLNSHIVKELLIGDAFRPTLLWSIQTGYGLWFLQGLRLLFLLAMLSNIYPRWSTLGAWILHLTFMQRNLTTIYGIESIGSFYLFYLTWYHGASKSTELGGWIRSAMTRLMQIQLCIIYGYSGFRKLQGNLWWGGEALWYVVTNHVLASRDWTWLAWIPGIEAVLAGAGIILIIWECYFPVLIWLPQWRIRMLALGLLLHIGIAITLQIPCFGLIMIALYLLFLNDEEFHYFDDFAKKLREISSVFKNHR